MKISCYQKICLYNNYRSFFVVSQDKRGMSIEQVDVELEKRIDDAFVDASGLVSVADRATHSKCLLFKAIKLIHTGIYLTWECPGCEIIQLSLQ